MYHQIADYDIAVIGAGHAGIEAALAAARLGLRTVCFTINLDAVGNMPCNPAIGEPQRVIWYARLMPWAARWDARRTNAASNIGCSTAARGRRCTPFVRRQTVRLIVCV